MFEKVSRSLKLYFSIEKKMYESFITHTQFIKGILGPYGDNINTVYIRH